MLDSGKAVMILKANAALAAVDLLASLIWVYQRGSLTYPDVRNVTATLLLLESGVLFLAGGFAAYGGTIFVTQVRRIIFRKNEEWTLDKVVRGERSASAYILLAVLLLMESLVLSFL